MISLDRKELDIIEVFWREGRDLTHKEILDLVPKSISANSVYAHLNTLIEKGYLEIGLSVRCGRTYGRTFRALVSGEEYAVSQLRDTVAKSWSALDSVVSMFLGSEKVSKDALSALEGMLHEKGEEPEG